MVAAPSPALLRRGARGHLVDRLAGRAGRVGIGTVLADLDRQGAHCPVPGAATGPGFTWDDADGADRTWWPQGVAVPGPESVPGTAPGDVLLISWYAKRDRWLRTQGVRITVVDRRHPAGPRYRHVRLVVPRRRPGGVRTGVVPVHAGGIAVVGDLLYVADTLSGLRLFRLSDVLRVPGGRSRSEDLVLPQTMALRVPLRGRLARFRFSFVSSGEVDGAPCLVVGEYRRAADRPPRLLRYALDPATGLPVTDARGRAVPVEVHGDQPRRMQGVAVHGADWVLTASAGPSTPGDLYTGAPGAWHRHRGVLPPGPEDLAWSRPGEELWSVSEWPGHRWVFPAAADRRQHQHGTATP